MNATQCKNAILVVAGLGVLIALPNTVMAGEARTKSLETLAAESASTPEQHLALVAYYREKAAAAREEVVTHREMALGYGSRSVPGMVGHCDNLAKAAEKEAAEYEALAAFHEAEAKKK